MVAVDTPLVDCIGIQWVHLFADTLEELHAAADVLGLKRVWFQNQVRHPHYDLYGSKIEMAQRRYPTVDRRRMLEMMARCSGTLTFAEHMKVVRR